MRKNPHKWCIPAMFAGMLSKSKNRDYVRLSVKYFSAHLPVSRKNSRIFAPYLLTVYKLTGEH
jgi:hypothetical protein